MTDSQENGNIPYLELMFAIVTSYNKKIRGVEIAFSLCQGSLRIGVRSGRERLTSKVHECLVWSYSGQGSMTSRLIKERLKEFKDIIFGR
jgi:hypothetical protein